MFRRLAAAALAVFVAFSPAWAINSTTRAVLFSGGLAPKFYANLKATPLPGWLTYSYTPSGTDFGPTYFDASGNLQYAPNNFILNSASFSTQTITVASGAKYILSATMAAGSSIAITNCVTTTLSGSGGGTLVYTLITTASTSCVLTLTGSATQAQFEIVTGGRTTPSAWNTTAGSTFFAPFVDYDPSTLAALGIRKEPAATNIITQSSGYPAGSNVGSMTVAANAANGPRGASTMTHLMRTTTASSFIGISSGVGSATTTYTTSIVVKAGAVGGFVAIRAQGTYPSRADATINTSTGAVTSSGTNFTSVSAKSVQLQSGAWRLILTYTTDATGVTAVFASPTDGAAQQIDATVATLDDAYIDLVQTELGSFATSPIPSYGAATARAENFWTFNGAALTALTGSQASVAIGAKLMGASAGFISPRLIEISDAAVTSNVALFAVTNTPLQAGSQMHSAQVTMAGGDMTTAFRRTVAGWNNNAGTLSGSYDGSAVVANNGGANAAMDRAFLGERNANDRPFAGWFSEIGIWNTNIPDAKKKAFSTAGAAWQ